MRRQAVTIYARATAAFHPIARHPAAAGPLPLADPADTAPADGAGTGTIPIAFVRAAWFMENAAWDQASASEGAVPSFLQPLDRAVPMVATADIGATAARLLRGQWTGRRVIELQGPAPVSPNELATTFGRLLGRGVRAGRAASGVGSIVSLSGHAQPAPRAQMLDGFNQSWHSFEGGDSVEAATGTTTLETVLPGLLASA